MKLSKKKKQENENWNISSWFLYENIFKLELYLLEEAEALSRHILLENAEKNKAYILELVREKIQGFACS